MKIWLITLGEPLPLDSGNVRLLRTGILFQRLISRGADVTWWTSAFDHSAKTFRISKERGANCPGGTIKLLKGCGYKKNISLRRFIDHIQVAKAFAKKAPQEAEPDLILVSYPTIELCLEAIRYADGKNVPVIVDVRDLWPDALYELFPASLRYVLKSLMFFWERWANTVFESAVAVTAITDEIVDWGLLRRSKPRRSLDRAFPMAYQAPEEGYTETDVYIAARQYWFEMGVCESDWIVCFFGTIGHHFDLGTVISSAKQLYKKQSTIKIVICGDGENRTKYEKMARGMSNVVMPGWVNRHQIQALMDISQIGLAPYKPTKDFLLSMPNKPLEYLSAGLPVVSAIEGVLGREIRSNSCGEIYGNESGGLFRVLMNLFHDNKKLLEYKKNAKQLFHEKYNADQVYEDMCTYLESIATGFPDAACMRKLV